jgi:hypothetical protein
LITYTQTQIYGSCAVVLPIVTRENDGDVEEKKNGKEDVKSRE